ncbi:hypothetical protein DF141_07915 [Burkholderia cenocepacia]|uniref:Uncharacterized protein n=2 Tax=Burkholderia cepacia complex TaxID=87882 RepID=A0ABN5CYW5_BURCE|nr:MULTISPECIES: hypothetical protein [Burkholderia]AIO25420.1 hypothetical protein DM41_517 [Burkholderia cepacia ATCC 25416]ALK16357.1 hypothetical protein APZ15_00250 [Burkholderia cepacia ATCC 25416]ASE96598.1 hypothetical protein CEQ23_16365 [Burkholderia cepacia]ATF79255.1 hypothetical protein CO711_04620 [Burkholderia cepacia]AWU98444.1 hypothetical protein DM992_01860 [Burkholderia sp. JP2-270]
MSKYRLPNEVTMIAMCAAHQFAQLEALFDAVRSHLAEGTYERALVDMGQGVASRYSAEMRRTAQPEVCHD